MFTELILSSFASGLIATSIMVFFLYLPIVWNGDFYDVLGALGSTVTRSVDGQTRFIGGIIYFVGGLVFSVLYGWAVLALLRAESSFGIPQLIIFPGLPVEVNLFYPLIGAVFGLGHGVLVALLVTIIVIEHHPLERYRARFILVISQLISHIVFGITVMFFHSQFLQLFAGISGAANGS